MTSQAGMIERMARAIADADGATCFEREKPDSDALVDLLRGSICAGYRKQARAALEAIRTPSNDMCVAGWQMAAERFAILGNGEIEMIWLAMIDAALSERP